MPALCSNCPSRRPDGPAPTIATCVLMIGVPLRRRPRERERSSSTYFAADRGPREWRNPPVTWTFLVPRYHFRKGAARSPRDDPVRSEGRGAAVNGPRQGGRALGTMATERRIERFFLYGEPPRAWGE